MSVPSSELGPPHTLSRRRVCPHPEPKGEKLEKKPCTLSIWVARKSFLCELATQKSCIEVSLLILVPVYVQFVGRGRT